MSIATRLESPTNAGFVAGTRDTVIAPDVTAPYRATSARRHHKRVTREQPATPKTPQAVTMPGIATAPTSQAEATQLATATAAVAPPARRAPITLSQPSWILVAAVAAAVGFIVWLVMFERLPDIDPRQIVATNLAAGEAAFGEQRYVEPEDRSALHYYTTVLTLDPLNETARSRIDRIGDIYIDEAKARLVSGKLADAGLALERARRARPDHPQLPRLNGLLRDELALILAQTRAPLGDAPKAQAVKDQAQPKAARVATRTEAVDTAASKADSPPRASSPRKTINLAQLDSARRLVDQTQVASSVPIAAAAAASVAGKSASGAAPIVPQSSAASSTETSTTPAGAAPLTAQASESRPPAAAPKVIKFVQPTYPNDALMRGIEGWVDVSLRVSPSGDVIDPRVKDSTRGRAFERAALNAVRQWKYESQLPGSRNFDERLEVRVEFRLTN